LFATEAKKMTGWKNRRDLIIADIARHRKDKQVIGKS
jgi:hypothetical protein